MTALAKRILALAVLAGLGAGVWRAWSVYRIRSLPRIILLSSSVEGIDSGHAFGLGRLIKDEWEVASGATVLAPPAPPTGSQLASLADGDLVMRLSGRRDQDALSLRMAWIRAGDLRKGASWTVLQTPSLPPTEAFARLERSGPLPVLRSGASHLLPKDPSRFWDLAQAASVQDDTKAGRDLEPIRELARAEPGAAAVWLTLGEHLYRELWTQSASGDTPQSEALAAFDKALVLVQGYPRAALMKGLLLTDVGDQRAAIRALVDARALRPEVPDLYGGLAYAGRTSGLLEGASRAVAARSRLSSPFTLSMDWFAENTYLYNGQWEAFRATISDRKDPVFLFYRGYLELIQGRPDAALPFFREGAAIRTTSLPFSDLCRVYAEGITGQTGKAMSDLRAIEEDRGRLQIPDGELTFKVAEAHAFLGQRDEAVVVAGRAFAQGFCCLAWYEKSPLFAPARQSPRWPSLRQHLRERRALMEQAYPPDVFG